MRTVEASVFQFEELSETAKETAREWFRTGNDFHAEFEPYETAARLLGISNIDISYSGFWSQGDGASFTGDYSNAPGCSKAIRDEFGTDTALHGIADRLVCLQATARLLHGKFITASILRTDTRYSHSGTMDIGTPGDEEDLPFDEEREKELLSVMRDFAAWIYRGLESDYDDQNSNEYIDDCITGNDYEFTENGKLA